MSSANNGLVTSEQFQQNTFIHRQQTHKLYYAGTNVNVLNVYELLRQNLCTTLKISHFYMGQFINVGTLL